MVGGVSFPNLFLEKVPTICSKAGGLGCHGITPAKLLPVEPARGDPRFVGRPGDPGSSTHMGARWFFFDALKGTKQVASQLGEPPRLRSPPPPFEGALYVQHPKGDIYHLRLSLF